MRCSLPEDGQRRRLIPIQMIPQRLIYLAAICSLFSLVGCGKPGPVPIEGIVTLDGQPLVDAEVIFKPDQGRPSVGRTDESGRYKLMYTQEEKGAAPGHHQVMISTFIEADDSSADPKIQEGRKETVPAKYNKQTTLEAKIERKGQAELNFELQSK